MPPQNRSQTNLPRPVGRPRLEDVAALEARLLAVALDEFQRHGFGGASVNAIAKAAKVSKTTLYSRFPSKESLFRAIMQQQIQALERIRLLHPPGRRPDLVAGLEAYADYILDSSFKGGLLKVNQLIHSEAHRFPELGAAAAERSRLGIAEVAGFIERCAAADDIPCKDAQSVAEAFIFMLRGWYVDVMLTGTKVPTGERERWIRRVVHVLVCSRTEW